MNLQHLKFLGRMSNLCVPSEAKIVMLGDSLVGKTSIVTQYVKHTFSEAENQTVGSYFVTEIVKIDNSELCFHIWDTAGQERYRGLIPMYSRGASAAILVIDVSNPTSLESIEPWYKSLQANIKEGCLVYLAANKIDLQCQIDLTQAEAWAKSHEVPFFTTTATSFDSVATVFTKIASDLMEQFEKKTIVEPTQKPIGDPEPRSRCC
ncbi:Ras-related protein Rab-5A [Histomonas meleagridis]|uniref:Ras-related protein Rab-5A n=1 Tax=Histomonas meleagridis TaxID=135588 RepID=UPI003559A6CA|nr:Ras-related protein Rab-5A [Histomonas meleagridis]KAH0802017.1 Ras-related protein Rab-5A [Histomonas meleagridis]